jgi:hypothetical protein
MVSVISVLESHPLRTMDALHVACALAVESDYFVAADHRQLSAARNAGLKIVDGSEAATTTDRREPAIYEHSVTTPPAVYRVRKNALSHVTGARWTLAQR